MNSSEFVRRVRKTGRKNGVAVRLDKKRGKGSHGLLYYGSRKTTVPRSNDIPAGTLSAMLRQLGLSRDDI